MTIRVVSSAHKAGLEQYGHRFLESRKNWPRADWWFYTEGYPLETDMTVRDLNDIESLTAFKRKLRHYKPPNWRFDIVRFSHKVWAIHDALYDYDGIGVWVDADCETYKPIPEGWVEQQVKGAYVAHFGRLGTYTETGFIIFDCSHPSHKAFLDAWKDWFLSERFQNASNWHDAILFEFTLRKFLADGEITANNLSGEHANKQHPMAYAEIGQYIDHAKGLRKETGISPENQYR